MRIIKGGFAIAALLSAGIATGAAAQSTTPSTQQTAATTSSAAPATSSYVDVDVDLLKDSNGTPVGIACPSVDPIEISAANKKKVRWTLKNGDEITIKMSGGSYKPFKAHPVTNPSNKKEATSQDPSDYTVGASYKYNITVVTMVNGKKTTFKLDPIIKITP